MGFDGDMVYVHKKTGVLGVCVRGTYIDVANDYCVLFIPTRWECLGEL